MSDLFLKGMPPRCVQHAWDVQVSVTQDGPQGDRSVSRARRASDKHSKARMVRPQMRTGFVIRCDGSANEKAFGQVGPLTSGSASA